MRLPARSFSPATAGRGRPREKKPTDLVSCFSGVIGHRTLHPSSIARLPLHLEEPSMAIAVTAETLGTLHRMHRQLEDLREQLAKGPRLVAVRSKQLESAEARHLAIQDEAKKAKLTVDAKQLQLRTAEAKLKDLDSKRNSCKTNREYQLLDGQIAADTMAMKVLEDEILEALERVDTIKQSLPPLDGEIATLKQQLQQTKQQVETESAALETEVLRVGKNLEQAEQELPEDSREGYRRITKSKGADAMAALDGHSCGGCCQQVTDNMVAELSMGRVMPCRSCGRLLYLAR